MFTARRSNGFWSIKGNQKEFFDEIAARLKITSPSDWGKLSPKVINQHGGSSIIKKYNGSFFQALQQVYPGFLSH